MVKVHKLPLLIILSHLVPKTQATVRMHLQFNVENGANPFSPILCKPVK
jgi:hypothetical protein